jgi:hypothetical protein
MSVHATSTGDLVPRPEATPGALREALAVLAPDRLEEMQKAKDEALVDAVDTSSTDPLRVWLMHWRAQIEILRRPDLVTRRAVAQRVIDAYDAGQHDDEGAVTNALEDLSRLYAEAAEDVRP